MTNRWLVLFWIGYLAFLTANFVLWFSYGRSTIFMTMTLYSILALIIFGLLQGLSNWLSKDMRINMLLLFGSVLLGLFAGELVLTYGVKYQQNYFEGSGSIFYVSPFQHAKRMKSRSQNYFIEQRKNTTKTETNDEFEIVFHFNELGMRERSIVNKPSSKDTLIIVGIGDSFTVGVGTHQDATWLRFLERKINQDTNLQPVYTLNLGAGGSDPFFEFEKLKANLSQLQPDIVILATNVSDLEDIYIRGGKERFERANPYFKPGTGVGWEIFYAASRYVRYYVHEILDYHPFLISYEKMGEERTASCYLLADLIKDFIMLGEQNGFTFILQMHPTYHELLYDNFPLDSLDAQLKSNAQIQAINLYHHFKDGLITKENYLDYYWEYDFHHNAKGYRLWGEELKKIMVDKNLLPIKE